MPIKKAVVLLSGGLDSAVTLYTARAQGYACHCLAFDYGQRHSRELVAARRIARITRCPLEVLRIALPWGGSALLDKKIKLPGSRPRPQAIPATYVPGRNIIFLSFAVSYAEAIGAGAVFIGAHTEDYSGYPDCRPEFYAAFSKAVLAGTKAGARHRQIKIRTPLINKGKAEIIRLGAKLGVPFSLTWSCYAGGKKPCGKCDSCYFRQKGFQEAKIGDGSRHKAKVSPGTVYSRVENRPQVKK